VGVAKTSGVTMVANPARNNAPATLTIAFAVVSPIVAEGSIVLAFPYQDY